ncbi:MAG: hypothetical protein HOB78_03430 [Flavobacteriales bacterium]|jgi:lipopolysaccharide export system protein LptA|nr:hypothetical protein [Flavobacteriales bacterium]MBT7688866.1 hypothetical protein [Flavobacteriales bacterium]
MSLSGYSQSDSTKKTTEIELLHADKFTRDPSTPEGASKLIGEVRFKHQEALMFCDSAYLYENNSLDAYGNVRIVEGDSLNIKGDSLFYEGNERLAKFRGDVVIDNKSSVLKTPFLDYFRDRNVAHYYGGGEIHSRQENIQLWSKIGHYFSDAKIFHFKGDVKMKHPDYTIDTDTMHYAPEREKTWFFGPTDIVFDSKEIYCEYGWFDQLQDQAVFIKNAQINSSGQIMIGDTIEYDEKNKIGIGRCNVTIVDTNEKVEISGDYAHYFEQDSSSYITDQVMMKQDMDGDTLFLSADTLYSIRDSAGKRMIKAFHHTKFFKSDMQGKCDSLVYRSEDSVMYMYRNPILWSDQNQLTADSIRMTMKDGTIDKMYMDVNAFIISREDSQYFNQIKGRNMIGYFKETDLHKVDVYGNGETIYYPREEDETLIGVNETKCARMTIKIDSNEMNEITFFENPVAKLTPSDDMKEGGIILEDFLWRYAERPESPDQVFYSPEEVQLPAEASVEEVKEED